MSSKTFSETALEFMKIYYSCHPKELPADQEEAFKEMMKVYGSYKNKLIDQGIKKNEDFFRDKF